MTKSKNQYFFTCLTNHAMKKNKCANYEIEIYVVNKSNLCSK